MATKTYHYCIVETQSHHYSVFRQTEKQHFTNPMPRVYRRLWGDDMIVRVKYPKHLTLPQVKKLVYNFLKEQTRTPQRV